VKWSSPLNYKQHLWTIKFLNTKLALIGIHCYVKKTFCNGKDSLVERFLN